MKKFLSLALALVMCLSLVTISAGATDFTDDSSITYGKAVDVISELGIVNGYDAGDFKPTDTLTRGAAAKIICNLLLGPTAADALGVTSAPFKDVPANHTFAGYIAYCSNEKIINGYGDGSFRPAGTVTGYQFLKMLLGALGYDSTIEQFTGSGWETRVASLAITNKLTDGNNSFVGSKAMTREEACLYAFNTLTAKTVDYKGGTNITTGDGTNVVVDAERYFVENSTSSGYKTSVSNDEYLQFCEKYFEKLKLASTTDELDRPADKWSYKNAEIGTYAKTPYVTFTAYMNNTSGKKDVKNALRGLDYGTAGGGDVDSTGNVTPVTDIATSDDVAGLTANGRAVEVYVSDNVITDIVALESKLVTVKKVAKDKVTLSGAGVNAIEDDDDLFSFFSGLSKDDKVMVLLDGVGGNSGDVIEAYEPETVTGKYTKSKGTGATVEYTVGGEVYQKGSNGSAGALTTVGNINNTYNLTLDQYGYIMDVDNDTTSDVYAYVMDYTANTNRGNYDYALKLLFADGTIKWVDVSEVDGNVVADDEVSTGDMSGLDSKFVSYSEASDGTYKVTNETAMTDTTTTGSITKGDPDIFSTYTASNKTVFLVKKGSSYTVYTGIKNVPSMSVANSGDAMILHDGDVAVMVVLDESASRDTSDQVFIYDTTVAGNEKDGGTAIVYYNALVNGEDTTIGVSDATFNASPEAGLYVGNYYTKEYISTMGTPYKAVADADSDVLVYDVDASGLADVMLKNGILTIDKTTDETKVVADEFNAYIVKGTAKEVDDLTLGETETKTSEGITIDSGDYVVVVLDSDGYATDLYLVDANA